MIAICFISFCGKSSLFGYKQKSPKKPPIPSNAYWPWKSWSWLNVFASIFCHIKPYSHNGRTFFVHTSRWIFLMFSSYKTSFWTMHVLFLKVAKIRHILKEIIKLVLSHWYGTIYKFPLLSFFIIEKLWLSVCMGWC